MVVTCELATLHALSHQWFVVLFSPVLRLMDSKVLQSYVKSKFYVNLSDAYVEASCPLPYVRRFPVKSHVNLHGRPCKSD